MSIKREIFRHKYYITQRDGKGRFMARVRWTMATPIKSFRSRAKVTGAIHKDVEINTLTNFFEVIDSRKKPYIPKSREFQGVATGTYRGKMLSARSSKTTSKQGAKDGAIMNLYILAYSLEENVESKTFVRMSERKSAADKGADLVKNVMWSSVWYRRR